MAHTLVKTIPAGPDAQKQAEAALDRMRREVADRTAPRTSTAVERRRQRSRSSATSETSSASQVW